MNSFKQFIKKPVVTRIGKILAIAIGSIIYAIGFQFFLFPNSIVTGGAVGIAMIINRFLNTPVGLVTIILNIPLFVIAWKHFGLDYLIGTLIGTLLSSVAVDIMAMFNIVATQDPMLACIVGGAIRGLGLGIVYLTSASTGGVDIIAKLLRKKYPHINFGTLVLFLDVFIILTYAFTFNKLELAMYSIISMFVCSKVIDLALYGIDNSSICYIISAKSSELTKEIISGHIHRGVTVLDAEGAYSGQKKQVIMCVIKRVQIAELRRLVKNVDENAFFIVADAKNVFGNGFEHIAEVK